MSPQIARKEAPETKREALAFASEAVDRAAESAVVGVFASHAEADQAVKALEAGGFSMRPLSIVGP